MFPHPHGRIDINRARMRLLFRDAGFGQVVEDDFRLDLEFARQLVDADLVRLAHCPPGLLLTSLLRGFRAFGRRLFGRIAFGRLRFDLFGDARRRIFFGGDVG